MAQNTRQQSHDRIDENDRGNRAIRQHVIANRDLRVDQMFDDAMIDPFVVPADNIKCSRFENSAARLW